MSWTQPLCDTCWAQRKPGQIAARIRQSDDEVCCDCGMHTTSGIYLRIDPATVKYPRKEVG